jgi:hypothetical protein
MCCLPVPGAVADPTRIGPGALLAALGEDLELGRAAEVYAALGYLVLPVFEPTLVARAPAAPAPDAAGRASIPASLAASGKPPPTRPWCGAGGAAGRPPTWRCALGCASTSPTWTANPVWRRFAPP